MLKHHTSAGVDLEALRKDLAKLRDECEEARARLVSLWRKRQELKEAIALGADVALLRRRFHLLADALKNVPRSADPEIIASAQLIAHGAKLSGGRPGQRPPHPLQSEIIDVISTNAGMATKDVIANLKRRAGRGIIISAPPRGPVTWKHPRSGQTKSIAWATIEDLIPGARKYVRDREKLIPPR